MMQPKEESKEASDRRRKEKKQSELWHANQSHKQNAENNDEPNGMASQVSATIAPERYNLAWMRIVVAIRSDKSSPDFGSG
jgi:hypothetical protein